MIHRNRTTSGTTYTVRVGDGPQRTFHRLKDAEQYEEEQRRNRRRGRAGLAIEQGPITYEALVELFLQSYDAPSRKWTEEMLSYSRKKFGRQYVRALRSEQIGAWLHQLPYSPKTKQHILERMRVVLNRGVEWGYLPLSPARNAAVRSPSGTRVLPVNPLQSWAEVEAVALVAAVTKSVYSPLIRFACSTGLRPGEWQALTWANVNRQERELFVPGTKTKNAARTIPLSQMAQDALDEIPRGLPHVRIWKDVYYKNFRAKYWPKALDGAELERRTPGQMRHTFATLALQAGVTIDVVSKWLGHSSIEITLRYYARYTRPVIDRNLALLDKLGETLEEQEEAK